MSAALRSAHVLLGITLMATAALAAKAKPEKVPFHYDDADETVPATMLDNPNRYDADIAAGKDGLWLAWLEFVPGKGDHVWIGQRRGNDWAAKQQVTVKPGRYANPTVTLDAAGRVWLSYEAELDGQWDVFLTRRGDNGKFGNARPVTSGRGPDIHHRLVADPAGGLWMVWQGDRGGQFDVLARHVDPDGESEPVVVSESSPRGDWHPDLALTPDGRLIVAWDAYDGDSYNVYLRVRRDNNWGAVTAVASSPAFEGRVSLAAGHDNRVWLLWEEGSENWGKPYRARMNLKYKGYMETMDAHGPLHRFRRLHLALLGPDGTLGHIESQLPMPAIQQARQRPDRPAGVRDMGAFYERGKLAIDKAGRLWLIYRHYYAPWLGVFKQGHVEEGWGVYARCLEADGWSKLRRFEIGQGDGMQRVEVVPNGDGLAAIWTTGRTDRRMPDRPRGLAFGRIEPGVGKPLQAESARGQSPGPAGAIPGSRQSRPQPVSIGGKTCELFFGDLHRHTDLSLCGVPLDGTIDDAYRYAVDVAELDFMGITDHSRDIAQGNPLSQLWWRNTKEVLRHELKPAFFPMYAYERSRSGEDHNVISLRADMLRPHLYPHPEFWKECDDDTFTIPHQTITKPMPQGGPVPPGLNWNTWNTHDEKRRPLMEVYQGCRDRFIESDAHEGLARGWLFGFIASSDHYSTEASYACVWAERRGRESIFRAMQARRTYGATAKIRLMVRIGEHWMGERFESPTFPPLDIEADGTAPLSLIEVVVNGEVRQSYRPNKQRVTLTYEPPTRGPSLYYVYVRLQQTDGNAAWSSPIWVNVLEEP